MKTQNLSFVQLNFMMKKAGISANKFTKPFIYFYGYAWKVH